MRFYLLLAIFFLSSCDYCSTFECSPGSLQVGFRLLNQAGDTDLVFGPTAHYHKDSIKFYTVHGADTILVHYEANMLGNDSVLQVEIPLETLSDIYLQLHAAD